MKQIRIPAQSIIAFLVIITLVTVVVLFSLGLWDDGAFWGGILNYIWVTVAAISTLATLVLLVYIVHLHRKTCHNLQCVYNPLYQDKDVGFDFTAIETPAELTTGGFTSPALSGHIPTKATAAKQITQPGASPVQPTGLQGGHEGQPTKAALNISANYGYPVRGAGVADECATMDFTIDMVQQVLAALQQAQTQAIARQEVAAMEAVSVGNKASETLTKEELLDRLAMLLEPEQGAPPEQGAVSETAAALPTTTYRGAHFRAEDLTQKSDVEPLFTILPKMKHARRGKLAQIEKAG
jgi:hypothetical protein